MTLKELPGAATPDSAPVVPATSKNRRRPGRPDHASPRLIPLLRTAEIKTAAASGLADELPFEDALEPATGVAFGVVLSVPLWAAIGGIMWAVL